MRAARIAVAVAVPPAAAALPFIAGMGVSGGASLELVVTVLTVSYRCAILPSIAYAGVMEAAFSRGLSPKSWRAVGLSSILGSAAGMAIAAVLSIGKREPVFFIILVPLGLFSGAVTGWLIKSLPQAAPPQEGRRG